MNYDPPFFFPLFQHLPITEKPEVEKEGWDVISEAMSFQLPLSRKSVFMAHLEMVLQVSLLPCNTGLELLALWGLWKTLAISCLSFLMARSTLRQARLHHLHPEHLHSLGVRQQNAPSRSLRYQGSWSSLCQRQSHLAHEHKWTMFFQD